MESYWYVLRNVNLLNLNCWTHTSRTKCIHYNYICVCLSLLFTSFSNWASEANIFSMKFLINSHCHSLRFFFSPFSRNLVSLINLSTIIDLDITFFTLFCDWLIDWYKTSFLCISGVLYLFICSLFILISYCSIYASWSAVIRKSIFISLFV